MNKKMFDAIDEANAEIKRNGLVLFLYNYFSTSELRIFSAWVSVKGAEDKIACLLVHNRHESKSLDYDDCIRGIVFVEHEAGIEETYVKEVLSPEMLASLGTMHDLLSVLTPMKLTKEVTLHNMFNPIVTEDGTELNINVKFLV